MSKMKDRMRRLFLYGGLEREDFEQIRDDITEDNRRYLTSTILLVLGLMIASVAASLILSLDSSFTKLYASYLLADVVLLIVSQIVLKRNRSLTAFFVWLCIAVLYSYAVMTTVLTPHNQATTMMVCLVIIPVIFALRPTQSVLLIVAMAEAFGRENTFRFGGDEFVSIVFDTPLSDTEKKVRAVQKKLEGMGYFVSYGMAEKPAGGINSDRMLMEAEKQMREAKARFYSNSENSHRARISENIGNGETL